MTAATTLAAENPLADSRRPELVWKRLAHLIAAPGRSRLRLWDPDTGKFSDTARRTDHLPTRPAAVYLYSQRRTHLLWLDFDAKHHGPDAVEADLAAASSWITQCGGVTITDRSTSGGRHLLCPLAIGTSASLDEMVQLVRLLGSRLRTLDITPNTNADTGCMTPPGSPCREGGYRELDGTLSDAVDALTTRSQPDLLPRLMMLLGALNPPGHQRGTAAATDDVYTQGIGDDQHIAAPYVRDDPLPPDVHAYATRAEINPQRLTWLSNHQARQSVVTNAIARGYTLAVLRTMIAPGGPWSEGLGRAYHRYEHRADNALASDVAKAFDWLITNVLKSSPPRHKKKNSPGGKPGPRGPHQLRDWLGNAMAWADREFAGKRCRWTVHAVLQTIAFHALVAGEERSGTWLVGVGGRTLSLSSGLLSEDTMWRTLADLREREGSPLIQVRQHIGTEPDVYALTTQNRVTTDPAVAERVRIEPVHDAWIVLGHHRRRIYELVVHHGLTRKADIYAATAIPRPTGDTIIQDLQIAGLLARTGRGTVAPGPATLDAIAAGHQLEQQRQDRIVRYRNERAAWRRWLEERARLRDSMPVMSDPSVGAPAPASVGTDDHAEYLAYQEAVMSTGPPVLDQIDREHAAIALVADVLGGRILNPVRERRESNRVTSGAATTP